MTRAQIEAHQAKHGFKSPFQDAEDFVERGRKAQAVVDKLLRAARQPNQTEAEFGRILAAQKSRHEIVHYEFEGIRLKWGVDQKTGEAMWYKPDWVVVVAESSDALAKFRCIEVKGARIWDRDIVRFKGCRAAWPQFDFQFWQKKRNIWTRLH